MSWLGSAEVVAGLVTLAFGLFLVRALRFVPQPGVTAATPSNMRLAMVPVMVLLVFVIGIVLCLMGLGLI